MDAIKQYLDYMFRDFPPTPEVVQARADLLDMMGDKYTQLREDGTPEHQAVAQVISDFGDLDELTATLGIQPATIDEGAVMHVDSTMAAEFLEHRRNRSIAIATGTFLSIMAVAALTTFTMLSDPDVGFYSEGLGLILGFGVGLVLVAVALFFFLNHPYGNEYERFTKTPLALDYDAKAAVRQERSLQGQSIRLRTILGIGLALMALLLVIVASVISEGPWGELGFVIGFAAAQVIAALAVWMIVNAQTVNNSFKILLEESDFSREKKENDPIFNGFAGVYWLGTTLLFLGLGFAKDWSNAGTIWVIWPIAGILFAIIAVTWDTVRTAKKRQQTSNVHPTA